MKEFFVKMLRKRFVEKHYLVVYPNDVVEVLKIMNIHKNQKVNAVLTIDEYYWIICFRLSISNWRFVIDRFKQYGYELKIKDEFGRVYLTKRFES